MGCFLFLLGLAGWAGLAALAGSRPRRVRANLLDIASRLGWRTSDRPGLPLSRMEGRLEGVSGELTYSTTAKWTRMRFKWAPPGRLRVQPEDDRVEGLRQAKGTRDLQTGDEAFDRQFHVEGDPEAWAVAALGPEIRIRLTWLASIGKGVRLEGGPTGVAVFVPRDLTSRPAQLERFARLAMELFQKLKAHADGMVQIVADGAVTEGGGECPVCGCPLDGEVHACEDCRTPHHEECWEYFGGCALYACGRTAEGRPRVNRRARRRDAGV